MDSSNLLTAKNKLEENINKLDYELKYQRTILHQLLQDTKQHARSNEINSDYPKDSEILFHYKYIFPLVKEIHQLELKIKENHEKLEERNLKYQSAKLCTNILAESFCDKDCVLRNFSNEIIHLAQNTHNSSEVSYSWTLSNISYHASFTDDSNLKESLAFTVLNKGVHIRVRTQSKTAFTNKHFLIPTEVSLCVYSDTFIDGLQEKILDVVNGDGSVLDMIKFVATYIEDDMAPYVIIVPLRKKKSLKKAVK
ncbi:hypothetical protein Btru_024178 [Bulinus truncatus]|nr:hypothetical protein Btru_024178 [Bulinus truncatus]